MANPPTMEDMKALLEHMYQNSPGALGAQFPGSPFDPTRKAMISKLGSPRYHDHTATNVLPGGRGYVPESDSLEHSMVVCFQCTR
jgi:hypothetical protein